MHDFKVVDSLLTSSNDDDIWLNLVHILGPLLLPTDSASHVTVQRIDLGELEQSLDRRVHCPELPTVLSIHGVDDSRRVDHGSVERNTELKEGQIRVGSLNGWSRSQEPEVGALC